MIYTIGYQKTTLKEIVAIMDAKGIDLLVDVRSWPYSRNPMKQEFNKNQLSKRLGRRYAWIGSMCGGKKGPVTDRCIEALMKKLRETSMLLLCMEHHPSDCHRFYDISKRLIEKGIQVIHLFDGQEKTTEQLMEGAP